MPAEAGPASRALEWLEPRLERVPEELGRAVERCLRRTAEGGSGDAEEPVPDLLARCAVEELDRLPERPDDRDVALRLLAADASLTWAFEAAAELGSDVTGLADRVGLPGVLGSRLASSEDPSGAGASDGEGSPGDGVTSAQGDGSA